MQSYLLMVAALALAGCGTDVVVGQEIPPANAAGASGAQGPDAGDINDDQQGDVSDDAVPDN